MQNAQKVCKFYLVQFSWPPCAWLKGSPPLTSRVIRHLRLGLSAGEGGGERSISALLQTQLTKVLTHTSLKVKLERGLSAGEVGGQRSISALLQTQLTTGPSPWLYAAPLCAASQECSAQVLTLDLHPFSPPLYDPNHRNYFLKFMWSLWANSS